MRIRSLPDSPFAVDVLPFRRRSEQWELAVVVKATYVLERGACRLLGQPIPVFAEERWFDEAAGQIYAPRDLVPAKAQPELVVVGVLEDASFRVAGGPRRPVRQPPSWPPLGSPADAPWHVTDLASAPLGEDFDGSLFQYAPEEQRFDALSLSRPVVLERADPRHPEIKLVFPPIEPAARIEALESTARAIVLHPELLWVDVERGVGTVTWRGTTTTDFADGFELVIGVSEGGDIRWPIQAGHVRSSSRYEENGDDPIDLPTDVSPRGVVAAESTTYTGEHPLRSAHDPAWLAPPGGAAAIAEPPRQQTRAIAPHPARAMIADPRDVAATPPQTPPERSSVPPPARPLALDVFWRDDVCADLAEREAAYKAVVTADVARDRATEPYDPWWNEDDEQLEEDLEIDELVMLVLREVQPTPLTELERAMMRAIDARRHVTAPVGMLAGELRLVFDARAELEVYAEAARPLAKSDKQLAATLEHVDQLLDSPLGRVAEVARGQRKRIAQQWRAANRDLASDFLERSVHEILLRRRSFETRDVLDEPHLRALLVDDDANVPIYLPEAVSKRLPLFHAFDARVIAELWPRQDERESHPVSLRAMAVARVVER